MTLDRHHPLPGRRPLVAGAARSGVAAARLLARHGAEVRICDRRGAADLPEPARALAGEGIEVAWGRDDAALLDGRDFVVWSPGIRADHPLATAARERGLAVIGELELGFLAARAPLVCITGTNGKSTTTDLTGALLRAAGREVAVCGNIGRALCEVAEDVSDAGLLVVEVSSFQLETVAKLKPFVATWLNLTPDHLDRHGSLADYAALKQRLFERQDEGDYAVRNADDPLVAGRGGLASPLEFSVARAVDDGAFHEAGELVLARRGGRERLMARTDVRLPGPHNLANALAALATVMPMEPPAAALRSVLAAYAGLEHRLEAAGEVNGVRFVNDSKATNTDSLSVALRSFERPVVLIAGGRDKGQDFAPLAALVRRHVRQLVLIGEGAAAMASAWRGVPQERAETLAEAVAVAYRAAGTGGVVLLSPGCASFDMFRDYEDRGRRFKEEVARLAQGGVRE
ncbi:MAG: UDP-N-acetylmuramoyl-L-alanine--D-glutamate ligase [Candidatus Eisenbacteria bacterium]|nr:UDP-N-acetylmuramoyl-L-alanine--D-glutamate ligase [Candidatus Eisenbacteria bacterium]